MKISIVTVVLNREKVIERCIQSVFNQTYSDIEYIVIDGGSSDGTLRILNKYKKKINILISEKDNGIYDAMNKGVALATGDFVYFLNSDDELYDKNVIEDVVKVMEKNPNGGYFYGGIVCKNIFEGGTESIAMEEITNLQIKLGKNIPHLSLFSKRKLFDEIGGFDTKYKVNADYEWECRLVKNKCKGFFVKKIIGFYDQTGFSSKISWAPYKERFSIIYKHFGLFYLAYFYLYSIIKFSTVWILNKLDLTKIVSKIANFMRGSSYKK